MYYAEIKNFDVANGPGVRVSLFVSGCPMPARVASMKSPGITDMVHLSQKR